MNKKQSHSIYELTGQLALWRDFEDHLKEKINQHHLCLESCNDLVQMARYQGSIEALKQIFSVREDADAVFKAESEE